MHSRCTPWLQVDMLRMEGRSGMKEQALRLCEQFNAMHKFEGSFWVSATRASGVQKLKDDLLSRSAGCDGALFWGVPLPQAANKGCVRGRTPATAI